MELFAGRGAKFRPHKVPSTYLIKFYIEKGLVRLRWTKG